MRLYQIQDSEIDLDRLCAVGELSSSRRGYPDHKRIDLEISFGGGWICLDMGTDWYGASATRDHLIAEWRIRQDFDDGWMASIKTMAAQANVIPFGLFIVKWDRISRPETVRRYDLIPI